MDDVLCDFSGEFQKDIVANPAITFRQSLYEFFIFGAIDYLCKACKIIATLSIRKR